MYPYILSEVYFTVTFSRQIEKNFFHWYEDYNNSK